MPDIDLEPDDYHASPLPGEPIFHPGWWKVILGFIVFILVGAFVLQPIFGFLRDGAHTLMFGHPPI